MTATTLSGETELSQVVKRGDPRRRRKRGAEEDVQQSEGKRGADDEPKKASLTNNERVTQPKAENRRNYICCFTLLSFRIELIETGAIALQYAATLCEQI